jgi:hypothetical protein
MSTTIIAFFNNKGGVGKTSLVYHLAWMYSDLGVRVVAVPGAGRTRGRGEHEGPPLQDYFQGSRFSCCAHRHL